MKRTIKITESQMRKIIDRISEGEYPMDEEVSPEKVKAMKQDLTDISDLTKELGLTSETEELLDEGMDYREALNLLSDMANELGVSLSDLDEKTKDSFVHAIMNNINPKNELAKTNFRRGRKGDPDIYSWDDIPKA